MLYKIQGILKKKEPHRVIVEAGGICYEILTPATVSNHLRGDENAPVQLILYHYFNIDQSRAVPILIGFIDELEKEFFEKFISVSGVGPKAALRAFDKPIAAIARAIEDADMAFLTSLDGIGKQRARQIVAHLQGKVGRFALLKQEQIPAKPVKKEIVEEAREILKRLQYSTHEAETMLKRALAEGKNFETVEELLNEIYRQRS